MAVGEGRVLRDALAWFLVSGGFLLILAHFGVSGGAEDTAQAGDASNAGYLLGVWQRSLSEPYQGMMLSAVIALPLHAAWTWTRWRHQNPFPAYEAFSIWVQALMTSLGFLGTIIGVSLAVAGLDAAMRADDPGALIFGLSTAFDTTFLGLTGAVLMLAFRKVGSVRGYS